jgi:hypothetical protein
VLFRLVEAARQGQVALLDATTGRFAYHPQTSAGTEDAFTYTVSGTRGTQRQTAILRYRPRLMALGGALTAGVIDPHRQLPVPPWRTGWRGPLQVLLAKAGYAADWVGTRRLGAQRKGFDPDVQAQAGWTAMQLAYGRQGDGRDGVYAWLARTQPDLILLQLGPRQAQEGTAGVAAILDEIDRWGSETQQAVTVLVMGLLTDTATTSARLFNQALRRLAAQRAQRTSRLRLLVIDPRQGLDPARHLRPDHYPTTLGYQHLAHAWYHTLIQHPRMEKCP